MALISLDDVQAWVNKKGGDPAGVESLRLWVNTGRIAGPSLVWARAYLEHHDRQAASAALTKEQELVERQTLAAEASAATAKDSESTARVSARVAIASAIVAVIALAATLIQTYKLI